MKKNIINKLVGVVLLFTIMVTLGACSKKNLSSTSNTTTKVESSLDKIKQSGKLVVGTSADYPPYEFHKIVNGKDTIVGFDIMLAEEIAKELGVQLEIEDITFNGLIEALNGNKIDMIIAGMNPTPERAEEVDFSKIYYKAVQAIILRTDDNNKYTTLADLNGKKVGVQIGTVQEELANKQIIGAQVKALGKITDLILELKNKKIDAVVVELPVAASYANTNKDLTVSNMNFNEEANDLGSAIALKKNSPELVDAINKVIDKLIEGKTIDKFVTDANNMVE